MFSHSIKEKQFNFILHAQQIYPGCQRSSQKPLAPRVQQIQLFYNLGEEEHFAGKF